MRGDGTLYQRGNVFWASYVVRGQRVRVSTGKENRREANDWLKERLLEAAQGISNPRANKTTVGDLADQWFKARETNGKPTEFDKYHWNKHLKPFFEKCKDVDVSPTLIRQYIQQRKAEPNRLGKAPGNGTINRELSILGAGFNLAKEEERLRHVPYFPMLTEENVREGFLRDEDYGKLADGAAKVGLWLRTLLAVYYNFGWRKSEAAEHLKVSQIDLESRTILLSRKSTKNREPKRARMSQEVFELLSACVNGKKPEANAITRKDGSAVGDFRKPWRALCISVGLGRMLCRVCGKVAVENKCECGSRALKYDGLLVHDLRRTSVRNLRRLGFAEKTIMEISGHKTAHIFRRYDIVDESDLAAVAVALDRKREQQQSEEVKSQLSHNPASSNEALKRDGVESARIQ